MIFKINIISLTGIEMKFKNQGYPILIAPTHISELNAVEHAAEGIRFGASVTLTTLEEVLSEACQSMPGSSLKLNRFLWMVN